MTETKPFEVARETLKQLSVKKLVPTPVNYQAIYSEIAGIPIVPDFPDGPLRQIAQSLPLKNPGQQKQKGLLDSAIGQRNWQGVESALLAYAGFVMPSATPSHPEGAALICAPIPSTTSPGLTPEFMGQIARLVENALPALGSDDVRFAAQVGELLAALRDPATEVTAAKTLLSNFSHRLSFAAEDQAEVKTTLLKLLQLIVENMGELSLDDRWLKGQTEALRTAAAPPLTLRRLDEVERLLKDVLFKQKDAKGRAMEAQDELRKMLATFIERLSLMTASSSGYHGKMEESVRLMEQARSLEDIAPVLKEVIGATRLMTAEALAVRNELQTMREKTQATDAELSKLHQELDRVSAQALHDHLTGALNRKGLDEALNRELSSLRRKGSPLCVSLLDIDNFKKLNDSKGHATGDVALAHLAQVARECMRPQDTLARYGGEEFVLLMPDTPLEQGIAAMTRLQRELSKRFFLAGTEKVLITFSAGVAQVAPDEAGDDAIKRADQAMYLAKRAGKNRVLGG
jgi:diguanylate cyclase